MSIRPGPTAEYDLPVRVTKAGLLSLKPADRLSLRRRQPAVFVVSAAIPLLGDSDSQVVLPWPATNFVFGVARRTMAARGRVRRARFVSKHRTSRPQSKKKAASLWVRDGGHLELLEQEREIGM